jgi:hypothetical protein
MLGLGNAALFAWGWHTAGHYDASLPVRIGFATTGALIGIVIIVGKLLLH